MAVQTRRRAPTYLLAQTICSWQHQTSEQVSYLLGSYLLLVVFQQVPELLYGICYMCDGPIVCVPDARVPEVFQGDVQLCQVLPHRPEQ